MKSKAFIIQIMIVFRFVLAIEHYRDCRNDMMLGFCCSNMNYKIWSGVEREREGGIEEKGGKRIILVKRRERV